MPKRSQPSTPGPPSAEAREALAKWGLALRYASAAVKPAAKQAVGGVKERIAKSTSGESSLKERINPSKTEKGGRVGDGADALLEKLGTPGKLAAKTSLGSRLVDRFTPDLDDADEDAVAPESAETEDQSEEAISEEPESPQAEVVEEEEEARPSEEESEEPDGSADEPETAEAEDRDEPEGVADELEHGHEGAAPLETDFEHAYSDEVENYEHQDAYASTR